MLRNHSLKTKYCKVNKWDTKTAINFDLGIQGKVQNRLFKHETHFTTFLHCSFSDNNKVHKHQPFQEALCPKYKVCNKIRHHVF